MVYKIRLTLISHNTVVQFYFSFQAVCVCRWFKMIHHDLLWMMNQIWIVWNKRSGKKSIHPKARNRLKLFKRKCFDRFLKGDFSMSLTFCLSFRNVSNTVVIVSYTGFFVSYFYLWICSFRSSKILQTISEEFVLDRCTAKQQLLTLF